MTRELQKAGERSKPAIFAGSGLVENNVENLKWLIRRAQSARTRINCGREACHPDKRLKYKVLLTADEGASCEYKGTPSVKWLKSKKATFAHW